MMSDDQQPDAKAVGYGKPPKEHQFKKGKSGNPKGRPKGSKSTATILSEALGKKLSLKLDGKTVKMTKKEVAIHQMVQKASAGDHKFLKLMLELDHQHGPQEEAPSAEDVHRDLDAMKGLVTLWSRADGGNSDDHA